VLLALDYGHAYADGESAQNMPKAAGHLFQFCGG
jgi:hypothetical protein